MSRIKRHDGGTPPAPEGEVEAFLERVRQAPAPAGQGGRGRLVLAMDATLSREHSWDQALSIQADMFSEAGKLNGLDVQLVYFRGNGECRASKWSPDTQSLARLMSGIRCMGGSTQILRVLKHLRSEVQAGKVNACVYIGDAMEESIDHLATVAGEIGLSGVPIFMFQEGGDPQAEAGFREIARLTRGAYFRFGQDSAKVLRELLTAVAVYAAGGYKALSNHSAEHGGAAALLLKQMK
jgi:hypothetical protein